MVLTAAFAIFFAKVWELQPANQRSSEFLGESDKKPFRPANVAEPIRVFILD
jgi:hypothetical protein